MKTKNLLLCCSCLPFLHATSSEPVDSYLSALVQGAGDNLWWVYPKEIKGQIITPPKGGYIFRIKIDLNADGVDEILLTTDSQVMRNGESWALYRGNASGSYVKLDANVWLRGILRVKTESGVKKYSYITAQDKKSDREEVSSFWLDSSGNFQTSSRVLTEEESIAIGGGDETLLGSNGLPDDSKIAQRLQLGTAVTLTVEKVLLGMHFQNPNTVWRAVNYDFTLSQQYRDPADAADIASLAAWQPPSQ